MANLRRLLPAALLLTTLNLHADTKRGFDAVARKDYVTAWSELMPSALQGDSEAEAMIGTLLFEHLNPPGTGNYADCEKWLAAAAKQNNVHALTELGKFYYADAKRLNSGINPGVNDYVPPAQRAAAEPRLVLARQMFERAAALGDGYAMANLAILVDAGLGGPKDPARAAQLRSGVFKATGDAAFAKRANADPATAAMIASWQQGHYADALKDAGARAMKGDPIGEELLGRAYYLGVGVPRNYATAKQWLDLAVAKNNADAMYFLGMMYEHGRGVPTDIDRSVQLFDKAAAMGQRYADLEVQGMRMQGESNRIAAAARRGKDSMDIACETAGGISTPGACIRGGDNIDPFNPYKPD